MAKRILVVEDDDAIRRSFSLFLKHKGYEVEGAADGLEGVEKLRATRFDLAVTDVMMPRMGGLDFLREAKKLRPALQIIMMTGYSDLATAIQAMKQGAVDFVTKPFQYDQLERTIMALLENGHTKVAEGDLSERLERKVHELSVLYSIQTSLESSDHVDDLFSVVTELACKITDAQTSAFFLYDRGAYYLKESYATGKRPDRPLKFTFPSQIVDRLAVERSPLQWDDPTELGFYKVAGPTGELVKSLVLAPLYVREENFGVLAIENSPGGFSRTDISFLKVMLNKASLQIENDALYDTIYNNLVNTLRSLVTTIEAKDPYTQRHSDRVTRISILVAGEVGCGREELDILQFAGMLHDIGKIGISDAILQKKGRLTGEEYDVIKQHPVIGERILEPLGMLPHERAIIRHHHERWDGGGYPDGLAGQDIPFLARIVSLADAYDAMTSDRVYRTGLSHEVAMEEIQRNSDKQFDGRLVEAFERLCVARRSEIENLLD
jgi:response regulator RpfG family c-di-GMP phosphodiesterase